MHRLPGRTGRHGSVPRHRHAFAGNAPRLDPPAGLRAEPAATR